MAGDIVVPIKKIMISEITKGIGYAVSSTKHVNRMKTKMEHLNDKSAAVRCHVDDYILNDSEIPLDVLVWLEDVERLKVEVDSITSEGTGSLSMKMSYRTGRKAFKIAEMIEKLLESNSHFKWTNAPKPMGRVGAPVLSSRDRSFNDALKFLQQDYNNSQVIALYGIDGVGKTTMMEQLRKVAQELKMFDWIAKLNIGINPNILSIQDDIAVQIGGERLPEVSVTARASCLFKKFKTILEDRKRKILVILDDVWLNFELKDIGLTSPMANGVKLLLTSRVEHPGERIAHQSGSDLMLVKVDVLEEEEAYNLLNQITGKEEDHEMYLMRCDIVQKCRGLPIAIKQICTILRNQNISERRNILRRLNRSDIDGILLEINRINYDYVSQGEDKEIFLLCGLFPENFDIPIEDLTRHAWALELFKQVSTFGEARDRTMTCVKNLINANLLILSHDLAHVKMPNLVHAFVLSTVSKENHPWVINHCHGFNLGGDEVRERCKRISLTCTGMSEFPRDFRYPNLTLIQLMNGDLSLKFQGDFYDHMENLQVIAYYNMRYPLLPRSLQNLKTLSLHKCTLMSDYSFLDDLVNLEVLSLAGCHVRRLPVNIGNLRKLKLLDLTGCAGLLIDDGVFVNLKNLQELYMRVSDGKAIRFTNANFEELKMLSRQLFALEVEFVEKETLLKDVSFKKLDKFKITVGCLLEKEKDTDKHLFKRILKIVTESSRDLRDCKIGELFNKTEKLHLHVEDMIQLQDVSHGPYQKHLFLNLRDLEVCNCVELKYLFPLSVASGLRKLERLTVSSCFVLQALVHDNGEGNVDEKIEFKKLRFLSLVKLPELVSLFPVHMVVELPQLVELEVDGLPNFTSIYPGKNSISPLLNSQVDITELKKLRIKSMNSLKQIWAASSEEEVNDNSMLKEIKVEGCDSLVNLFPTNPMRLLRHLEELRVWNCGSLEVIFNVYLRVSNLEPVSNSSLRVIEVHGLKNVREVWRIQGGESNVNSKISFAGVESISIKECNMFRSVITPTNANIYMRALAKISIYDCGRGRNKEPAEINVASLSSLRLPRFTSKISDLNLGRSPLKVLFHISKETTQEHDVLQLTTLISNLKNLRLSHMARMTHVWKGGNSLIPLNQSSFNNLTTIYLYQCKKIKYLFSPLMAKLFCNLQKIHLDACDAMEQVVSNRDEKITTSTSTSTATFFPKFHSLILHFLTSLEGIGGTGGVHDKFKFSQANVVNVVCSSLFRNSREIHISWCDGLSGIFETQGINNISRSNSSFNNDEGNGEIHNTSHAFPKILNINVPQLSNLTKLVITNCSLLQHVFTFSTLESLKQLQELQIQECEAIKVIVKEENEEQKKVVEFPCLISLKLSDLQNLKGFYLGMNSFNWPLLETVMISKCPQMEAFTNSQSITPNLKYVHTSFGKHSHLTTNSHQTLLLSSGSTSLDKLPWSFHNLLELHMPSNYDPNVKCIIPFEDLPKLQMLEKIKLEWCFHVNEVFEVKLIEETNNFEIPKLRDVELSNLEDLKYIWKGGKHVLLFPNLTTISIDNCENLEHVFTSSMIGHLKKLQYLHISTCSNMKVIIMEENDIEVKDIVLLPSLKFLELEELQSLEEFWKGKDNFSWPFLHTLKIKHCPKMKNLETPSNVFDPSST